MNSKIVTFYCFVFSAILNVALSQDNFKCYSCGYMETHTGERVKIPSKVENIPFCGNDTIGNNTNTPTKPAPEVIFNNVIVVVFNDDRRLFSDYLSTESAIFFLSLGRLLLCF